jgi:hypothetical protein
MPANTKAATSAEITSQLEFLRADLTKVNATIELIGKPAITKAEQLVKAITDANEQLAVALANEAEAERQARLAGFGNITVTVAYPSNYEGNLLRAIFTVEYTRLQYNMAFRAAVMKPHKLIGFSALPADVLEYLVEKRPEAIPAEISNLAPADPWEAFRRYFLALRRGRLDSYAIAA